MHQTSNQFNELVRLELLIHTLLFMVCIGAAEERNWGVVFIGNKTGAFG